MRSNSRRILNMTTKSNGKGKRIVRVTLEFFQDIFTYGARFETDLPDDARLLSFHKAQNSRWNIWMKFESEEWDELSEGEKIPFLDVKIEKEGKDREYFLDEESLKYD